MSTNFYDNTSLSRELIEKYRIRIDVHRDNRIESGVGSKGNQFKWVKDNIHVKLNFLGYEDIAEICTCWLLHYVVDRDFEFVEYYPCTIYEDGVCLGNGVFSYDYLKGWEEVTFTQVLRETMASFSIEYENIIELFDFVFDINIREYLDRKLCIDAMVRNEDSHWGNFILLQKDGIWRTGPIFDYGASCMSDCVSYPIGTDFNVAYNNLRAKPFKTNFEDQVNPFCKRIALRYNDLISSLDIYCMDDEFSRAIYTMIHGLEQSRNIAWEAVR